MSGMLPTVGAPFGGDPQMGGRRKTRRNGMSVKALKRALKKAGLKTTGKKAALTKRAKKAHLMRGGGEAEMAAAKTALENAVAAKKEDLTVEKQAAKDAGWSDEQIEGVITAAKAKLPDEQGGRRTRHKKGRRHVY